jgi:hypothetical protein
VPENRQIDAVWHPNPKQLFVRLLNGRLARAHRGEMAYQVGDSITRIQAQA